MATDSYKIYSEIRDKLGYKDSQVASGAGVTKSTFSDWKAGRYQPKEEKMKKIADFLCVSVDYLKTGKYLQADCLYTDEEAEFLVEITNEAKRDSELIKRMKSYISLSEDNQRFVDNMIEFLSEKEKEE